MKMRRKVLASMLFAFLPWLAMAQSTDDLYFIPKKEKKTEVSQKVGVVPKEVSNKTVNELPSNTAIVVKDVKGNVRDVDEYNRRYTSRDNTFTYDNDTLYIEEKPYNERGEWVNGFQGSDMDYEYAMRIVRFRNPRYAIPISSPLYWDVVYGAFPSWDWNVYDDGMYAYIFPTYTNRLWWDWRWSYGLDGIPHGTLLGIMVDGIHHGMQVIGVATGVVTGELDGIITIIIRIMDGTADGIAQDILTTDQAGTSHITEVVLLSVQDRHIPDVHSLLRLQ